MPGIERRDRSHDRRARNRRGNLHATRRRSGDGPEGTLFADGHAAGSSALRKAPMETIAGLEPIQVLGRGARGTTFLARGARFPEPVAVKTIRPALARREGFASAFLDGYGALSRWNHPSIQRVHEVGRDEGRLFKIEAYAPAGSLAARLREGPLPEATAAAVFVDLLEAIVVLESAGRPHAALKPENVLLGPDGRARVADPSVCDADRGDRDLAHAAPERVFGVGDSRSDIYSAGALLHHMATGRPPCVGSTRRERMEALFRPADHDPRRLRPAFPDGWSAVALRCLASDPRERYATAAEAMEDARRVAEGGSPARRSAAAPRGSEIFRGRAMRPEDRGAPETGAPRAPTIFRGRESAPSPPRTEPPRGPAPSDPAAGKRVLRIFRGRVIADE